MATAEGGGTRTGIGMGMGLLLGCGGCCLITGLALVGITLFVASSTVKQLEQFEAQQQEAARLRAEVAELEGSFPQRFPEDAAEAHVSGADVDDYLATAAGVAGALQRHADVERRLEEMEDLMEPDAPGDAPSVTDVFAVVREGQQVFQEAAQLEGLLREQIIDSLRAAELRPSDFLTLIEIVEWRFLGRDEARGLVLDPAELDSLVSLTQDVERLDELVADPEASRSLLAAWLPKSPPEDATTADVRALARQELTRLRGELAALEATVAERRSLSPETTTVLEARREELESRRIPRLDELVEELRAAVRRAESASAAPPPTDGDAAPDAGGDASEAEEAEPPPP